MVEGTPLPPDPTPGTGSDPFFKPTVPMPSLTSGSRPNSPQSEQKSEGVWSLFDKAISVATEGAKKVKETAASTVEHAQQQGWADTAFHAASQVKSTATQAASWGASQASSGMNALSENRTFQATTAKIGETLNKVGLSDPFDSFGTPESRNVEPRTSESGVYFSDFRTSPNEPVTTAPQNVPLRQSGSDRDSSRSQSSKPASNLPKKDLWEDDDW